LIEKLNEVGAKKRSGNRGFSRKPTCRNEVERVYETPGGTILYAAHKELEHLTLDRQTLHFKEGVAIKYAELVYDGNWYTVLREALDKFVDSTQETVTGTVKLKLYKGSCTPRERNRFTLYIVKK